MTIKEIDLVSINIILFIEKRMCVHVKSKVNKFASRSRCCCCLPPLQGSSEPAAFSFFSPPSPPFPSSSSSSSSNPWQSSCRHGRSCRPVAREAQVT